MFNNSSKGEIDSHGGGMNVNASNFVKHPPDYLRRIDQIAKTAANSGNQTATANSEGYSKTHFRCDSLEAPGMVIKPHTGGDVRWDAINMVSKGAALNLSHFQLLKRLGYGDIGSVYLVELRGTHTFFAMKVMDKVSLASRNKVLRAQTEREILGLLDHPFLPTLYSYFETDKFYCLVMEFCSGGNLHSLRQKQPYKYFTEEAARLFFSLPLSLFVSVYFSLLLRSPFVKSNSLYGFEPVFFINLVFRVSWVRDFSNSNNLNRVHNLTFPNPLPFFFFFFFFWPE